MLGQRGILAGLLLLICLLHSGASSPSEHVETTYVNVQGPDEIIEGKPHEHVIVEEKPEIKEEVSYLPEEVKTAESHEQEHGGGGHGGDHGSGSHDGDHGGDHGSGSDGSDHGGVLGGGHGGSLGGGHGGGLGGGIGRVSGNTRVRVGGGMKVKAKHVHKNTDWISEYAWSAIKRVHKKVKAKHQLKKEVEREVKRLAWKTKIASPIFRREPVERQARASYDEALRSVKQRGRDGLGIEKPLAAVLGVSGNTRVRVGGGMKVKVKHVHKHTDWASEKAWSAIKRVHKRVKAKHQLKKQVEREAKRFAWKSWQARVKSKIASRVLRREPVERRISASYDGALRSVKQWRRESVGIAKPVVAVPSVLDCGGRACRSNEKCVTRRSQIEIDQIDKRILKHAQDYKMKVAIEVKKHNAALSSRILKDNTGEKFDHACEGGVLTISCPAEYVIHVLRGFYGRTSDAYCNHGTPKTYQCTSPRASGIFATQCNGKQSCRVNSANSVFGDPCVGTYKYASVTFKCRLSANTKKRYDSERVQLNQVFQLKIKGLHSLNVRQLNFLRNLRAKAMRGYQQCVAKARAPGPRLPAVPKQGIMCGHRRCKISQSCITIQRSATTITKLQAEIKQHERSYQTKHAVLTKQQQAALRNKLRHFLPEQFSHACEHTAITVACPAAYVIQVIRGFYGRRTDAYCNHGKPKTFSCSSDRANSVIASLCNLKNTCTVKSTNIQFGDPCPGTFKYASINYRCRLPFSAVRRHTSYRRQLVRRFRRQFEKLGRWYRLGLKDLKRRLVKATSGAHRCLSKRGLGDLDDRRRRGRRRNRRRDRSRKGPKCGEKRCTWRQACVRKVSKRGLQQITDKMRAIHNKLEKTISIATQQQKAAIDSKTIPIYLAEQRNFACEGGSVTISCPVNYGIQVLRGFYGRTSDALCATGPRKTFTCSSLKADREVMSRCNGKPACTVESNNKVFGDPCVGTYKYLTVNYRCRLTIHAEKQFETERARLTSAFNSRLGGLRNSYRLTMASLKEKWRKIARGKELCVRREGRRPSIGFECGRKRCRPSEKCVVKRSEKRIRQLNDSIIALTSRFNQKIALTSREQLSALRKDTLAIYLAENFDHACEGAALSIHCPEKYVIQVLRGFYGRISNAYCSHGPRKTFRCTSSIANSRVISACNNKRSCTLYSSNSVFGDPCVGTYKYMTVSYKCRLSSTVEKQFQMRRKRLNMQFKVRESALHIVYNRQLARLLRQLSRAKRGGYRCVRDKQRRGGDRWRSRRNRRQRRTHRRRKSHRKRRSDHRGSGHR